MSRPKKKAKPRRLSAERARPPRRDPPAGSLGASRRVVRWIWTAAFFVMTALLIGLPAPPLIRPGDVALRDYVAAVAFKVEDRPATDRLRHERERKTWRVFNDRPAPLLSLPGEAVDALRSAVAAARAAHPTDGGKGRLVPARDMAVLAGGLTRKRIEELLKSLSAFCKLAAERGVMDNKYRQEELQQFHRWKILALKRGHDRPVVKDILHETIEFPGKFREMLEDRLEPVFRGPDAKRLGNAVADVVVRLAKPTLEYNAAETRKAVRAARRQVKPVSREVAAGATLIWRAETATPQQVYEVREAHAQAGSAARGRAPAWRRFAGVMAVVLLVFWGAGTFMTSGRPVLAKSNTRFAIAGCAALLTLLIARLLIAFGASLYLTPVFLFAVLQTLLFGRALGLSMTGLVSLLLLLMCRGAPGVVLSLFAGGAAGAACTARLRRRTQLIEAGLLAGALQCVAVWSLGQLQWADFSPGSSRLFKDCLVSFVSCVTVGFVLSGLLPYIERVLKLVTDLSLSEWSDRNQPLLRRLAMEAPGTHHHSLMVGALAEAAAEAIHANPLLARAGGYFHDVGKLLKPEYFIENTQGRPNPHTGLSPTLSALIITSHPRDGVELAEQYGLPAQLRDLIGQHHGTTAVDYFYNEALTESSDPGEIDRDMFRYRGPKPNTRESAIVLLADSVEPATRSLSEATPARIERLVRDITKRRLTDGQLDESDLTFAEVRRVQESLARSLLALFHHRIKYPDAAETAQKRGNNSSS